MLKYFQILIISLLLICSDINAQWVQTNGPMGGSITAFSRIGNHLFAGSRSAGVFVSVDNGKNWRPTNAPDKQPYITSLAVIDSELYAGTQSYGVIYSSDFGNNWISIGPFPETEWEFLGADCLITRGQTLYAGTKRGVFQTTDMGANWSKVNPDYPLYYIQSLAIRDTMLFAVTGYGVYRSSIHGSYWRKVFSVPETEYTTYVLTAKDSFLVAGSRKGLFLSTNNGDSWIKSDSGISSPDFTALAFIGQDLLAGTYKEGAYISSNYGRSWRYLGLRGEDIMAFTSNGTNLYAGTYPHGILVSAKNDTNWTKANLINSSVSGLTCSGNNLMAGAGRLFMSTSDLRGWTENRNGLAEGYSPSLFASDGNMVAAAGSSFFSGSAICISTDNGLNWTPVPEWNLTPLIHNRILTIALKDSNIFIGTFRGMFILNYGAAEWTQPKIGLPDQYQVWDIAVRGSNIIAAIADSIKGYVYLSSDNGYSWRSIGPADCLPDAVALMENYIITVTIDKGVLYSSDNGKTWTIKNKGLKYPSGVNDDVVTLDNYIFYLTNGTIYFSTIYDESWRDISTGLPKYTWINSMTIFNDNLYIGTSGKGVWMCSIKDILTSVNTPQKSIPAEFELLQNYPNPFNPMTTISYSIPEESVVELKIFDLLGQQIETLVNEKQTVGKYNVEFDGSSLPSGVYIYILQAGQFRNSKKLLLLK